MIKASFGTNSRLRMIRGGKRLIRLLTVVIFSILAISVGCRAQLYSDLDTLSITSAIGNPTDTISLSVILTNSFAVGGFQARITFDEWSFRPLAMHLAARTQRFDLFGANFDEDGVAEIFGTTWRPLENAIAPGRGAIAILDFIIQSGTQPGYYLFQFEDSDTISHQNSLSNCTGDSLVIPILVGQEIQVNPGSDVAEDGVIPGNYTLSQNYPNPFNGPTRISFTLSNAELIDLTVYNLLGQSVTCLFSGWANPGENVVYWDSRSAGQNITSGVYFYRLHGSKSGDLIKTMTLLK
jgi:hypothetical protein